ncbi:hypothetical protein VTO42DRAFT_2338 [Malbranchea cinnamomea]
MRICVISAPMAIQETMGRLPVLGVGWYRRKLTMDPRDEGKTIYLDIDGAMSYAMVWLDGKLVGGWPYPYNSFRLDPTPYLKLGHDNQLAIRLDNPKKSARWYPGGGLYRKLWLTKTERVHVAHWGTFITPKNVSKKSATVNLVVEIENNAPKDRQIEVVTDVHVLDAEAGRRGRKVATFEWVKTHVRAGQRQAINETVEVLNPRLWGPPPTQTPNLYVAVTRVYVDREEIDTYETRFGIRSLTYDSNKGLLVNGERFAIQGANQHHNLGARGSCVQPPCRRTTTGDPARIGLQCCSNGT